MAAGELAQKPGADCALLPAVRPSAASQTAFDPPNSPIAKQVYGNWGDGIAVRNCVRRNIGRRRKPEFAPPANDFRSLPNHQKSEIVEPLAKAGLIYIDKPEDV